MLEQLIIEGKIVLRSLIKEAVICEFFRGHDVSDRWMVIYELDALLNYGAIESPDDDCLIRRLKKIIGGNEIIVTSNEVPLFSPVNCDMSVESFIDFVQTGNVCEGMTIKITLS